MYIVIDTHTHIDTFTHTINACKRHTALKQTHTSTMNPRSSDDATARNLDLRCKHKPQSHKSKPNTDRDQRKQTCSRYAQIFTRTSTKPMQNERSTKKVMQTRVHATHSTRTDNETGSIHAEVVDGCIACVANRISQIDTPHTLHQIQLNQRLHTEHQIDTSGTNLACNPVMVMKQHVLTRVSESTMLACATKHIPP